MSEEKKALPPEGWAKPAQDPKQSYDIVPRDRLFLIFSAAFCLLFVDTFLWRGPTSACLTATVFAWCALTMAYTGPVPLLQRSNCILLLFDLFLGLTMMLGSNWTFRAWNCLALLVLLPVQTIAFSGAARLPWWRPAMLWERFLLLIWGLFGNLGAFPAALTTAKKQSSRRLLPLVLGALGAAALVAVLLPILSSADALFAAATAELRSFIRTHFTKTLSNLIWALALTPFVFGLLYSLRHPKPLKAPFKEPRLVDSTAFILILAALDLLYLLFLAVQSAGLFGGPAYLARKGISYAEWARSGFFQMVGVTVLNLTVIMTALSLSRREGRGWKVLRLLAAPLVLESLVLLVSAAWRMTLYVSAYGLSFKRCMTYWGMVMMALFLLTALLKVRKPDFCFCKAAIPLAMAGWMVINCIPIDYLVAKNQVDRYLSGESSFISIEYLVTLSYDTLHQLDRLSGMTVNSDYGHHADVDSILAAQRDNAAQECADWHTWSLSAWLASGK